MNDPTCQTDGHSGRFALPLAFYSYQKDTAVSSIRADIEIYDRSNHQLVESLEIVARAESNVKEHAVLMFTVSKATTQVTAALLRRGLVDQIVKVIQDWRPKK